MVLIAALVFLLAQTAGASGKQGTGPDATGLLDLCGTFTGNYATPQDTACLAYVSGLADSIRTYEALLSQYRDNEVGKHLVFIGRMRQRSSGCLPTTDEEWEDLAGTAIRPIVCLPAAISDNRQLALVIIKYVREHPERLHEPRVLIAVNALQAAFPCPAMDRKETKPAPRPQP